MNTTSNQCSLTDPRVCSVLNRLHQDVKKQRITFLSRRVPGAIDLLLGRKPSAEQEAHRHKDLYLAISRPQGIYTYLVGRSISAQTIVEFGTSFGVSTIYLAAAVKDGGGGQVIGSEIEKSKAIKAQKNLRDAGLDDYVEIRVGDAQRTLAGLDGPIDLVLLDGWKQLYLPMLKMLTSALRPGAVILADNVDHFKRALAPYTAYVRDIANGFQSVMLPFRGGFEHSVWLGQ